MFLLKSVSIKIKLIGLLFLSSFFFIALNSAKAYTIENYQDKVEDRFVISPVNLELNLMPDESTTQNITIINRLGRTAEFTLNREDFIGSEDPEKSTVFLGEDSSAVTSARNWISTEIEKITLNHGDRLTLPVSIKVPKGVNTGSHYTAVFVSVASPESSEKDKVKLVSRVGTLILINVPGNNQESGEISDFNADRKFYRNGPVEFNTVFKNTGNVYQKVRGEITITNILGAQVAQIPIKDWVVLSNASRRQTVEWDKKWLVGRYKAHLTAFYGLGGNLTDKSEVIFYAFPWHIALLLMVILVMFYFALKYLFSKFEIRRKEKV